MKPKLNFIHACEYVVEDKKTNKLSIMGIFDSMNIKIPGAFLQFFIVAELDKNPKGKISLELYNKDYTSDKIKLEFSEIAKRLIARFTLVKFNNPGIIKVKIFINDKDVGIDRELFEVVSSRKKTK